jgi:hypothetical protein
MKEGRIFNPASTFIHPQDTKEYKNLTSPHPNIWLDNVVNVDCPHIYKGVNALLSKKIVDNL